MKRLALIALIVFFLVAGINHFVMPEVYDTMMPPYFPMRSTLNILTGIAEILCAMLLIFSFTRRLGAIGVLLLLIAFIPVHVYMLQEAPMPFAGGTLTVTGAWIRLAVHPVLMLWAAWFVRE